jgi:UrcA family protein
MNNLTTLLAATAVAACGLSTTVRADSILEPRSVTVRFADLDTNNAQGAAALYRRIRFAAESVCGDLGSVRAVSLLARYRACVHATIADAVARVNRPTVTEYAVARGVAPADAPNKTKIARNDR